MFSLSWFTTPAGICITVGVLLLIVALILFIVTSKKDKKNKGVVVENANGVAPVNGGVASPNGMQVNVASPMQNGVVQQPTVMPGQTIQTSNVGMEAVQVPGVAMQPVVNEVPLTTPSVEMPTNNAFPALDANALGSVPVDTPVPTAMPVDVNTEPQVVQNIDISSPEIPTITEASEPVVNPMPVDATPSIPVVSEPTVSVPVVEQSVPNVSENVVEPIPQINEPIVNTAPNISEVVEAPTVSPVMPTDMNSGINVNEVAVPSVEQVVPELQGVETNNIVNNDSNYTNTYNTEVATEPVSAPAPAVPIYGGSDPIVPSIAVPAEEHQIYGGANPLENTQSVSISDIANGINSSQGYTAPATSAVPTINTDTSAVVTEPIATPEPVVSSAAPIVSPSPVVPNAVEQAPVYNEVQQPSVATAPVVNPINNNFSYQSAAAPQVQIPTPSSVDGNIQ